MAIFFYHLEIAIKTGYWLSQDPKISFPGPSAAPLGIDFCGTGSDKSHVTKVRISRGFALW